MFGLAIAVSLFYAILSLAANWQLGQHIALTMQIVIHGFVSSGMDIDAVSSYFYDYYTGSQRAQFYIYVTQTLIGDSFMV